MLNITKSLLVVLYLMFLSGCATKGVYKEGYISKEVKTNLNKVNNTDVCLVEHYNEIISYKRSHPVKTTGVEIDLKAGEINNNILRENLKQYFTNVSNKCNDSSIKIESYIKDFQFDWNGFTIQGNVYVKNQIKVYRNNKEILNKDYFIEGDNKVILAFESFTQTPTENMVELYHRSLLEFYETEFKKDLIEALQSNK